MISCSFRGRINILSDSGDPIVYVIVMLHYDYQTFDLLYSARLLIKLKLSAKQLHRHIFHFCISFFVLVDLDFVVVSIVICFFSFY